MDLEPLFTQTKWSILKLLSSRPMSPIEIAAELDTTLANVSQQLRLLEAAGILKKERIREREKNKPRILFSLVSDFSYIITLTGNYANKKKMVLDERKKFILRCWEYGDSSLHQALEGIFSKLEPIADKVNALALCKAGAETVELMIFSDCLDDVKAKFDGSSIKGKGEARAIKAHIYTTDERAKRLQGKDNFYLGLLQNCHILYDPKGILTEARKQVTHEEKV
jgi:predicted transcriptional regulator